MYTIKLLFGQVKLEKITCGLLFFSPYIAIVTSLNHKLIFWCARFCSETSMQEAS